MKRLLSAAVLIALTGLSPAQAATDAECAEAWTQADADRNGVLTEAEGTRYFAALRVANRPIADGQLNRTTFLEHCKNDLFAVAKADPNAPLAGANSFTEAQARDRILWFGLTNVTGLKKDENGIWRGTASDGAKTVNVAVDFKGNVVVN